jgi:hypothetical protein
MTGRAELRHARPKPDYVLRRLDDLLHMDIFIRNR